MMAENNNNNKKPADTKFVVPTFDQIWMGLFYELYNMRSFSFVWALKSLCYLTCFSTSAQRVPK